MFFEQMLDLAFELAARGFPETNIAKALISLGCPATMAAAVARMAAKRGATGSAQASAQNPPPKASPLEDIEEASWGELEPYYEALILGRNYPLKISEDEILRMKGRLRENYWRAIPILAVALFFAGKHLLIHLNVWHHLILFFILLFPLFLVVRIGTLKKSKTEYLAYHRTNYYLKRFADFHAGNRTLSMNWSAFFFNSIWSLYRRMWRLGIFTFVGYILLSTVFDVFEKVNYFSDLGAGLISLILGLSWSIVFGLYGNKWYYNYCSNKLAKFQHSDDKSASLKSLSKIGGPSWAIGSLIYISVIIAFIGILAAIALPAYQDYVKRSQLAQGQTGTVQGQSTTAADQIESDSEIDATNREYHELLSRVEQKYPELNPKSKYYNQEHEKWVVERLKYHQSLNGSLVAALRMAIVDYEEAINKSK